MATINVFSSITVTEALVYDPDKVYVSEVVSIELGPLPLLIDVSDSVAVTESATISIVAVTRYWVGGTGTWDATDTTHWATSTGGTGGASVPHSVDTAVLDGSSGSGTVSLGFDAIVYILGISNFTGTFDAAGFSPLMGYFDSRSTSPTSTLTMGAGTWTMTGGIGVTDYVFDSSGVSVLNAGTSTIKFTNSLDIGANFQGSGLTFSTVWFARGGSTGPIDIDGSNTFSLLKDTGTTAHSFRFQAGRTQHITTWEIFGSSGALVSITSQTGGGSSTASHSLVKDGFNPVSADYLNIQHSIATPTSTWYAGVNSVNNQAVSIAGSGWNFTTPDINKVESVAVSEDVTMAFIDQPGFFHDTVSISEDIRITITGTFLLYDVAETITVSENIDLFYPSLVVSVSDSITVSENREILLYAAITSDSVVLSESILLEVKSLPSVYDSVTVTENIQFIIATELSVFDSVTVSEDPGVWEASHFMVFDSATLSEDISALIPAEIFVFDSVVVTDIAQEAALYNVLISETVTLSESITNEIEGIGYQLPSSAPQGSLSPLYGLTTGGGL